MLSITHWPYVYVLLLISLSLLIEKVNESSKITAKVLYTINTVMVFIFIYMKSYGVGADDDNYLLFLKGSEDVRKELEPAFYHLLNVMNYLKLELNDLNLFVTIVFSICAYNLSQKFNVSYLFWLIVYISFGNYYELNIDHIRNALALAVVMYAVIYLVDREYFSYYLLIVFATLIHYSSCIFLVVPLMMTINYSLKKVVIITLLSICATFIPIYSLISNTLLSINISILNPMMIAIQHKNIGSQYAEGFSWSLFSIQKVFLLLLFSFFYRRVLSDNKTKVILVLYLLSLVFWAVFHEIYIFSGRFSRAFSIVEPFVIYYLIIKFKHKQSVFLFTLLYLFLIANLLIENRIGPYF